MTLFSVDATFNGIMGQIRKSENRYKQQKDANTGGFITPQIEKEFNLVISYWRKNILNGNNRNLEGLEMLTMKTGGDIKQGPADFVNLMIKDAALYKMLTNKFKANKNISEYSFIRIYLMAYSILTDSKYVAVFKKAYANVKKTKTKPTGSNVSDIFVMIHTILCHYVAVSIGTINTLFYSSLTNNGTSWDSLPAPLVEDLCRDLQKEFKGTIAVPGYATIDFFYFFNSLGASPVTEFSKAVKAEEDTVNEVTKSKENFNYYKASEDKYLVNRTSEATAGTEEALTVILVLVGIIAGILALGKLIQVSIYKIASIKVDIVKYVLIEYEILRMGIDELDDKIANEKDPKVKRKYENIKKRQEDWMRRYENFLADWGKDMYDASVQAQAQVEADEAIASETPTTTNDNYSVVL
jgi:hypothetical protein